jgi:hypothetical protein
MLTAPKSLFFKIQRKIIVLEKYFFSICFASGFSPYNDAFLNFRKRTKNLRVNVIWDLIHNSSHPREKKKDLLCHGPLVLACWMQFFVTVYKQY